ncbi:MAG: chromosomal replication initiator protein DnaA [Sedimentisphaerales bacterium]|nr:chromosomal replication initiator protein DnaA [Sedimentisphaerales bacterium]
MKTQDTAELFTQMIDRIKAIDPVNSRTWFDDLRLVEFNGGRLEIGCPDEATAQFLQDQCSRTFTQAAQNITGHLVSVHFGINGSSQTHSAIPAQGVLKLHPDYSFDNFVVGPCNRLAHASCMAVSHSPGTTYNPLFLYGNVGLGKTHLLHAVCHEARKTESGISICFLSCEAFVNTFISAIEKGTLSEFQSRLRSVDILIIDDVQFLREREQSQEEFFHTFNALYNNRRQIILTADSAPSELSRMEERLISRFKWGLVARLDAPSYETRIAIVQKKAHLRGLDISEDIAALIANKAQTNIRELEGALTIIYATAKTAGEPISLDLARRALGEQMVSAERPITITDIINAVTKYFDVRQADLQSKKRSQSIALPRQICMYLARNLTKHSLEEIGGHLGGRDHSTVLHACGKIDQLQQKDPATRRQLDELSRQIQLG